MPLDPISEFQQQVQDNIRRMGADTRLQEATQRWIEAVAPYQYAYNFTWLGRPIIQTPQDVLALQELAWKCRPDLIIETGIAHGGSLIFHASMLELIGGDGRVLGIDVDIRPHNRREIEAHPLACRIDMLQGSSIDPQIIGEVRRRAAGRSRVMVVLDSNHTHAHVLAELQAYSSLVTPGNYLIVFDTAIEQVPDWLCADRPWSKGNSPRTAVDEFLLGNQRFEIDRALSDKLAMTAAPGGYLRCVG
jgi:cephalosporin hydroxylase